MKNLLLLCILTLASLALAQDKYNLELVSQVKFDEDGNDIWGYVDKSGTEYAIMGTRTATRIFSLEDPTQPKKRAVIKGARSIWRDIKSYKNHLYVTTDEGEDGLLIIDMSGAPEKITHKFWKEKIKVGDTASPLRTCHNLYIDTDQGYAYLSGCKPGNGVLILDLNQDLDNPVHVGTKDRAYSHDAYVKDDILYSSEINIGQMSLYDIKDKSKPKYLGGSATTTNFTHNAWLSDDKKYLFTTDEKPNAFVDAFDVSNPSNIEYLSSFQPEATKGNGVIPHNTHYHKGFIVTSWYTDGVIITDVSDPKAMVQVGSYDTWLGQHGGFKGCWGAYPYLPSGLLLVSDINSGLYILQPKKADGTKGYQRAAYLEGRITDANTGDPIPNATVSIHGEIKAVGTAAPDGKYKTGYGGNGGYRVIVSHPNYGQDTSLVILREGAIVNKDFRLGNVQLSFTVKNKAGKGIPGTKLIFENQVTNSRITIGTDDNGVVNQRLSGSANYKVYVSAWGYKALEYDLRSGEGKDHNIVLEQGYEDPFVADIGWTKEATATTGEWEMEHDLKKVVYNGILLQPDGDSNDMGSGCYVTETNKGSLGSEDIDNGAVTLISPTMDFSGENFARITYSYFFIFLENDNPNDDKMTISVTDGTKEKILRVIDTPTKEWTTVTDSFSVNDIAFGSDLRFKVEAGDYGNPHFVEAYFDNFSVELLTKTLSSTQDQDQAEIYARPNPFVHSLELYGDALASIKRIAIYDILGRKVVDKHMVSEGQNLVADRDLDSGVYILQIYADDNRSKNIKIIKK